MERRVRKELKDILADPVPGCMVVPDDTDISKWTAFITGPKNSFYEGGKFKLAIQFPKDYPFQPPIIKFITSIYHAKIEHHSSPDGTFYNPDGHRIFKDSEWSPAFTVSKILKVVLEYMNELHHHSQYSDQYLFCHHLWHGNRHLYMEFAREWTAAFATEVM